MYMAVNFETVKRVLGVLAPLSGGVVGRLVWVVTLLLLVFSIAAIFSIGIIALLAALLFLIYSAVLTYDLRIKGYTAGR